MDKKGPTLGFQQTMRQSLQTKQSQRLELKQKLLMSPQLRQAIELLQIPTVALLDELHQEVESNPLLIIGEDALEEERLTIDKERSDEILKKQETEVTEDILVPVQSQDDKDPIEPVDDAFDWEGYFENGGGSVSDVDIREYHRADSEYDPFLFIGDSINLTEHLKAQIGLQDFTPLQSKIAEYIIGNLDDNGYLRITIEEISTDLEVSPQDVLNVLKKVQRFDPIGVAARNLSECLKIQLEEKGIFEGIVYDLVSDLHLLEQAAQNPNNVAKELNLSVEEIKRALTIIRSLNPKPGLQYKNTQDPIAIPEAKVYRKGNEYIIEINNEYIPEIYISRRYYDMLKKLRKQGAEPKDIKFLEEKLSKALLMMKAVSMRKSTVRAIVEQLIEIQRDFFDKGPRFMKPLTRREIAQRIQRDESTVSRATLNKYIDTPHGIISFNEFFPSALKTKNGKEVSSTYVKMIIQDLVRKEDPVQPLSDEDIARKLAAQGIEVARRTVAKYRGELGILSSSKRRKRNIT